MKGSVGVSMGGTIEYVKSKKRNRQKEIVKDVKISVTVIVQNII